MNKINKVLGEGGGAGLRVEKGEGKWGWRVDEGKGKGTAIRKRVTEGGVRGKKDTRKVVRAGGDLWGEGKGERKRKERVKG